MTMRRTLSHAILQGSILATAACGGQADDSAAGSGGSASGGTSTSGGSGGGTTQGGRGGASGGSGGSAGSGVTDGGLDSSVSDSGSVGGSGGSPVQPPPVPQEKLGCDGPVHDGGYWGQCCKTANCYTPEAGACVPPEDAHNYVSTPPGSGSCGCDGPIEGPYSDGTGACCYIVGSIGCDGRPLLVAGRALVAPLVRRHDWGSPRVISP